MIRVTGVTKYYGKFRALDQVQFALGKGEFVVFLGQNGSGKSTLYRCLLGITSYDGTIYVADKNPLKEGKAVRRMIGYMPQHPSLHVDLTVEETLGFYAELRGDTTTSALAMLERTGLRHTLTYKVGELSGGMKQRLAFVTSLIGDPSILLLDEPTANMDERSQHLLDVWLSELKEAGKTILVSTHFQNGLLSLADRTITLASGQVHHMSKCEHLHGSENNYQPSPSLALVGNVG
jgi:ABC-type multidrug transport system ATPase subunit